MLARKPISFLKGLIKTSVEGLDNYFDNSCNNSTNKSSWHLSSLKVGPSRESVSLRRVKMKIEIKFLVFFAILRDALKAMCVTEYLLIDRKIGRLYRKFSIQ